MALLRPLPQHSVFAVIGALLILLPQAALAGSDFSIGVEGFRDRYEEAHSLDTHTDYGSVTAGYTYTAPNGLFGAIDGRYSQGKADYKSESGKLDGIPDLETDLRLRTGVETTLWHGHFMPYIGLGWRYYFDQGKGLRTSLNLAAYDRHISQLYLPLGVTYQFEWGDWTIAPTAEFDDLIHGVVNTHLAAINADSNVTNQQSKGYGWRGELMFGQQYRDISWAIGPFIRFWTIQDSNCVPSTSSPGTCNYEPKNTRLQYGAALRIDFY